MVSISYSKKVFFCLIYFKSKHIEDFEQCLFYGEDVNLKTMILLKNEGASIDPDGNLVFDENGKEYNRWSAYSKIKGSLVKASDDLSLSECIERSIKKMILDNRYPNTIINRFNAISFDNIELPDKMEKVLTLIEAKYIANRARNEVNDENDLNGDFVDTCDLCAEKVSEILLDLGYKFELKNNFYLHKFEDCDEDFYGHIWIESNGIIIDPSRSQFDSTDYAVLKKENDNYKESNMLEQKRIKNKFKL